MTLKLLGKADLSATTNTSVYTVGTGKEALVNVNVCNRNSSAVTIRLANADGGTPSNDEYIEYDYSLAANESFQRTGLHLQAAQIIVAYSSATNVSVVVDGLERTAT
jgi:hypothetical protein|tara:strand:+ start:704 stop:1024 length:321 start_codon:yes stop_codon:yes gene_type:complete